MVVPTETNGVWKGVRNLTRFELLWILLMLYDLAGLFAVSKAPQ